MNRSAPIIRQAQPVEAETVSRILTEAAQWLDGRGLSLWRSNELLPDLVSADVAAGLFFLAEVNGEPAGTVRFQLEDPICWPDAAPNESTFLHRLAIRRQ